MQTIIRLNARGLKFATRRNIKVRLVSAVNGAQYLCGDDITKQFSHLFVTFTVRGGEIVKINGMLHWYEGPERRTAGFRVSLRQHVGKLIDDPAMFSKIIAGQIAKQIETWSQNAQKIVDELEPALDKYRENLRVANVCQQRASTAAKDLLTNTNLGASPATH